MTNTNKPIAVIMVGPPGCGKSTYVESLVNAGYAYISADFYIEQIAQAQGKTYGEVFKAAMKEAEKKMFLRVRQAVNNQENIVWDQTNMSVKSRAGKLAKLGNQYDLKAIAFELSRDELDRRLAKRVSEGGKSIPKFVIDSMMANYQRPSASEGFSSVQIINDKG